MSVNEDHNLAQQRVHDEAYRETRSYWFSTDAATHYIVLWRLKNSIERLQSYARTRFGIDAKVLLLCAGDGAEATLICNEFGFKDVTFSDISPVAVASGTARDPRLKGIVANAEETNLPNNSFDVVIVQDGLHHLQNPVRGFTEMLRIAKVGVIFIEPHDVLVGKLIGTEWEVNGEAVNYVFRWSKTLVEQVSSSYLGPNSFSNLSYSYWHHNIVLSRLGVLIGGGRKGKALIQLAKWVLDHLLPGCGNNISGIILKNRAS